MPAMVKLFLFSLFLDVCALQASFSEHMIVMMLGWLWLVFGPFMLGLGGAAEAMVWMLTRSPWALPGDYPRATPPGLLATASRLRARYGGGGLVVGVLRLMSGCCLTFCLLFLLLFWFPKEHLDEWFMLLLVLQMQMARLFPASIAAVALAPLLALSCWRRRQAWLHAGLATVASGVVLLHLLPNLPGLLHGLLGSAVWVFTYGYALMVGGVFWWCIAAFGPSHGRDTENAPPPNSPPN